MGEYKDINDQIYDRVMSELDEYGYDDLTKEQNDAIVDAITGYEDADEDQYKKLLNYALSLVEE